MAGDLTHIQERLVELVEHCLTLASDPEQLVEVARAAVATGDRSLMTKVAERLGEEIQNVLGSSSAWDLQTEYNKLDAWNQTGHRTRMLAEAWGLVAGQIV